MLAAVDRGPIAEAFCPAGRIAGIMERINAASWDRALRVVAGVALLALGWAGVVPGWWALAAKLFGLFPLATGLLGWDPFYALFGVRTGS